MSLRATASGNISAHRWDAQWSITSATMAGVVGYIIFILKPFDLGKHG
jgi:hypothetical protein